MVQKRFDMKEPTTKPRRTARSRVAGTVQVAASSETEGQSRVEYVYQALREAIQGGTLRQGMRLREEELAETLGVSRTPVREALSRLVTRGLAEVASGRGLVIAQLTSTRILELYNLRAILEGAAARFAAEHASQTEVKILRNLIKRCGDAQTPTEAASWNQQFHRMLYEVARNRYLVPALSDLHDSVSLLAGTTFSFPGRNQEVFIEHEAIVNAIEAHDADAAEAAARLHVLNGKNIRLSLLFADADSPTEDMTSQSSS